MSKKTPLGMPPFFGTTSINPEPCCTEDPGCSGCCGRDWDELPETLEFRISSIGLVSRPFNFTGTMYKLPYQPDGCRQCIVPQKTLQYQSQLIKVLTDQFPGGLNGSSGDSETCCVQVALVASCSDGETVSIEPPAGTEIIPPYDPPLAAGECFWGLHVRWTGGDRLSTWSDVTPAAQNESTFQLSSCNPIELDWAAGTSEGMPACILGNSIAPGYSLEIKESGVGAGDPAEACRYLCCAVLTEVLYAEIESDCAELHDKVVELRFGNESWSGEIILADCEGYKIVVTQHERYAELDTCPLIIEVFSLKRGRCFTSTQDLGTAPACPPWSASGTIAAACGAICGGQSISITINM
jgi:hypothetical protein